MFSDKPTQEMRALFSVGGAARLSVLELGEREGGQSTTIMTTTTTTTAVRLIATAFFSAARGLKRNQTSI